MAQKDLETRANEGFLGRFKRRIFDIKDYVSYVSRLPRIGVAALGLTALFDSTIPSYGADVPNPGQNQDSNLSCDWEYYKDGNNLTGEGMLYLVNIGTETRNQFKWKIQDLATLGVDRMGWTHTYDSNIDLVTLSGTTDVLNPSENITVSFTFNSPENKKVDYGNLQYYGDTTEGTLTNIGTIADSAILYLITSTNNGPGTVAPASTNAEQSTQLEFKFNPEPGKEFLKGQTNGADVVDLNRGATNWLWLVTGTNNFVGFFTNKQYQVTAFSSGPGSVNPSGIMTNEDGSQLVFDFYPQTGKEVLKAKTNSVESADIPRGSVSWNHTLKGNLDLLVYFTNKLYAVTATSNGDGIVTPNSTNAEDGTQLYFSFFPGTGKEVLRGRTNSVESSEIQRGSTGWLWTATCPLELIIDYTNRLYHVTATNVGPGKVTPSSADVEYGQQLEFNLEPDPNKIFSQGIMNGSVIPNLPSQSATYTWNATGDASNVYFQFKFRSKQGPMFKLMMNTQPTKYGFVIDDLALMQRYILESTSDVSQGWEERTNFTSNSTSTTLVIYCSEPKNYFRLREL